VSQPPLRFLFEAAEAIRILRETGGQHFDRDVAAQGGVARAVHFAHSPSAHQP